MNGYCALPLLYRIFVAFTQIRDTTFPTSSKIIVVNWDTGPKPVTIECEYGMIHDDEEL